MQDGLPRCWSPHGEHTWTRWIFDCLRPWKYRHCTTCHMRERKATI